MLRQSGGECSRELCRADIALAICWRRWRRALFCRHGDGAPCSGRAERLRCSRSTFGFECGNQLRGSNIASVVGAIVFGQLSERLGRRYSILGALTLSLVAIPAWAFGGSLAILIIGACLLQAGVQGAWGIIPAHLNELSPDAARGLIPG